MMPFEGCTQDVSGGKNAEKAIEASSIIDRGKRLDHEKLCCRKHKRPCAREGISSCLSGKGQKLDELP